MQLIVKGLMPTKRERASSHRACLSGSKLHEAAGRITTTRPLAVPEAVAEGSLREVGTGCTSAWA